MGNARHKRVVVFFLVGLAGAERKSPHRSAVKCAEKSYRLLAPRMIAGQFKCGFHGLGAGVAEEHFGFASDIGNLGQLRSEIDLGGIVEIRSRHVDQFSGLVPYCLNNLRMTMPGRIYGYTRRKIQELVPVDIPDP